MNHPTFLQVARQPRWIGVLAACLLVAAIFALLGQWQIARAVEQGQHDERDTETAVALVDYAVPAEPLTSEAAGRVVTAEATMVPGDYLTIPGRNQEGVFGCWVSGHALVGDASLAVAVDWHPDCAAAEAAIERYESAPPIAGALTGRYMPSEPATEAEFATGESAAMSVGWLVNVWANYAPPVYAGYVILHDADIVGEQIISVPPEQQTQLNWLNVFYAAEWIIFCAFAFYLWYRLVLDAREREIEAIDEAGADEADSPETVG